MIGVPTLNVSPWDMLKDLSWSGRAKLLFHSLKIIRDPEATGEIFKISSLFLDDDGRGQSGLAEYLRSIYDIPGVRALYEAKYLPPPADVDELLRLPVGTLGHTYARHMKENGLEVQFYPPVEVVDEATYLELRGRQTHDILHVVTGFGTAIADELGLQAFVAAQVNSPLSGGIIAGGLLHASTFKPWIMYECLTKITQGFALGLAARNVLAYRFEDHWATPLTEVRAALGL